MTETEAQTKWCPMVRVRDVGGKTPPCIGSLCMMWRWEPLEKSYQGEGQPVKTDFDGFCGLAGKP